MESLVSQFLSFPPKPLPPDHEYDKAIKAHLKLLNTTGGHKLRGGDSGARLLEVRKLPLSPVNGSHRV